MAEGLAASNTDVTDPRGHLEVVNFGSMVLLAASKAFAIRMAAVFMMSLATIWLKTGLMPRWLVGLSYAGRSVTSHNHSRTPAQMCHRHSIRALL